MNKIYYYEDPNTIQNPIVKFGLDILWLIALGIFKVITFIGFILKKLF